MKKWTACLLALILVISLLAVPAVAEESGFVFSEWNPEAPALKALIEYVEDVTNEASPDYIPPADRIATFDMDGTLIGELFPTYLEVMLLTERILKDPDYQPDEEMLEFGRMTRDHALDKSFPADYDYQFSWHQAKAFAGMTLTEYADFITRFLVHEADGFEGMTYAGGYYLPMAEVLEYLQENGFKCFVVSGSDRFIVRTFMEGMANIPYENIIGSDTALAAKNQGDTDGIEYVFTGEDTLVRTDRLIIKDLKTNKVLQIAQEIGRQPVLSFGNSSGDVSMNNYALLNNRYRSAAFMVVADDDVREYGNPAKHDELTEKWQGMGYHVISMRDDWKTIYGEDVTKTGVFRWLEEYADDGTPATAEEQSSGAADSFSESLFDDDEYYGWLYGAGESEEPGEELALANLLILWDYNSKVADWCRQEAEKLPENSEMRKEYEDFAVLLQNPMPKRPTEEESKALADQYLANISGQLQEEAVDYYKRCVAAEPAITADLFDIAEEIGTEMFGIGFRLKSAGENSKGVCRIAQKISSIMETAEAAGAPVTYREAAESIHDLIRYTQLGTPDTLVWNYLLTKEMLEKKGYRFVRVKNTWKTYSVKSPYRGVNVQVEAPSGIVFELQFHTSESLVTKMVEHINYEIRRDPGTSVEEKAKLVKEAYGMYDRLTEPDGIELIQ